MFSSTTGGASSSTSWAWTAGPTSMNPASRNAQRIECLTVTCVSLIWVQCGGEYAPFWWVPPVSGSLLASGLGQVTCQAERPENWVDGIFDRR